jgi:hypothetical protein
MRYTTSPKGTDLLQERWWKGSAILCGTTVVGLGTMGIAKHTDSRGNGQRPMAESRDPDSSRWPALIPGRGEHEDCVETAWPFAALGGGRGGILDVEARVGGKVDYTGGSSVLDMLQFQEQNHLLHRVIHSARTVQSDFLSWQVQF